MKYNKHLKILRTVTMLHRATPLLLKEGCPKGGVVYLE